jgi:YaiO family outer membrane protein
LTIRRRLLEPGALALILLLALTSRALAQTPVTSPDDPDAILTRALELRRLNRKADALATIERAVTIAPQRSDIVWWRDLLEHEVHGWEVTIGGEYREWDETRTPWREAQFTVRRNTAFGPLAARASHAHAFGRSDQRLELEAYPAFGSGYGFVGIGYATDATLYARSSIAGELFTSFATRLEASVGYRRLNFPNEVNVFTGSLGGYYDAFFLGARVNNVTGGATGTAGTFILRRYLSDDGQYIGLQASTGSVREQIESALDLAALSSTSIGADALFIIQSTIVLTGHATAGQEELITGNTTTFWSVNLAIGVRF